MTEATPEMGLKIDRPIPTPTKSGSWSITQTGGKDAGWSIDSATTGADSSTAVVETTTLGSGIRTLAEVSSSITQIFNISLIFELGTAKRNHIPHWFMPLFGVLRHALCQWQTHARVPGQSTTEMFPGLYTVPFYNCTDLRFQACVFTKCNSVNLIKVDGSEASHCQLFEDRATDYRDLRTAINDKTSVYFEGIFCLKTSRLQ